ncbi:T9SS type B sorting domain-containing protein [Xanthomarina sp. F2636L]|uniref:T9SS type B sorting domain-containing protein n=1 Tax=Xanthomarina sp. F2636L TaxID=2996018 RepID=UPI00225E4760|nr:T9SS type B sorting domain-containing protein [Xanthomarina sp. F2636L]MCX7549965.1 T9SS type B sorting domain-containing protein [Xanthomarina sp. F2636L]
MNKLLFYIFLLSSFVVFSQEEASNWYFGENAGIQFALDGSVTVLNDGQLDTVEGCSSISDENGNLLFYTDGTTVYNSLHNVMSNGYGLLGDSSSSQSAIVVPKPNDPDIYYIFTVGSNQTLTGLKYSVVDMTRDGGFGQIVQKNINLLNQSSEKVTAVLKDCQSQAIWVISLSNPTGSSTSPLNTFHAFEVTTAGVNTTAVTSTFTDVSMTDLRGYLKLSPSGEKLACANVRPNELYLFDFDTDTGVLSNNLRLNINSPYNKPYGIEFSPNSELLYVSSSNDLFGPGDNNPANHFSVITQFDLTNPDIVGSQQVIDQQNSYRSALQLGPNGKIYRSMSATYDRGLPYLSVINNPNEIGPACNYQNNAIDLGTNNSTQGLPPFISSFFIEKIDIINNTATPLSTNYLPLCLGENYTLTAEDIPGASYYWTFNGNPLPNTDYFLNINQDGIYEVLIDLNNGGCDFLEGEAIIEYFAIPVANAAPKMDICDDNNDALWEIDFTTQDAVILGSQDPDHYSIHYFDSQADAEANQNEIIGLYSNLSNPQEIFARVDLTGSPSCYDTTSFFVEIFNTPTANNVNTQQICDNDSDGDFTNGQVEISLHDFDSIVLGEQDATAYTITYHPTLLDAENNTAELSEPYYNLTPFTETISVRIENNLKMDCFDTTTFDIIINPAPTPFNTSLLQCDEDGVNDGRTFFNLNEANSTLTGGVDNLSTAFYFSLSDAENSNNPLNAANYNNIVNPQIIYAQVIDDTTGCFNIAELSLEVSITQLLDYQAPPVCDELDSEDGFNTFNLNDFEAEMQALNGITFPITFFETYEDALLEQNELTSPYNNTIPYNQTLYARAENNNACYGISEVYITINKLPELEEDETLLYCLNTFPQSITLDAGILNDSTSNYSYLWSTGETSGTIQINEIGTYSVTATNIFGCSKSRTITVEPSNTATFNDIIVVDATENNTITVLVSGEGEYEYALYNQDGLYYTYQTDNSFYNVYGGIYSVAVRDIKNNCGIVTQDVSIIGFPKFFTPNGDGYNDTWNVKGVSNVFQPNTMIYIYDRYGKLIKQINPLGTGWDGTFNGEPLPTSDYWFSAILQDGREFKSHFTLKR